MKFAKCGKTIKVAKEDWLVWLSRILLKTKTNQGWLGVWRWVIENKLSKITIGLSVPMYIYPQTYLTHNWSNLFFLLRIKKQGNSSWLALFRFRDHLYSRSSYFPFIHWCHCIYFLVRYHYSIQFPLERQRSSLVETEDPHLVAFWCLWVE